MEFRVVVNVLLYFLVSLAIFEGVLINGLEEKSVVSLYWLGEVISRDNLGVQAVTDKGISKRSVKLVIMEMSVC